MVVTFFDTKVIADIFNSTYNTIEISPPEMGIYDPTNCIAPYTEQTRETYKDTKKQTKHCHYNRASSPKNCCFVLEKAPLCYICSKTKEPINILTQDTSISDFPNFYI